MNRTILFLTTSIIFLLILQTSLSQEDENIKMTIKRFSPGLNVLVPQGSWKRFEFFISNQFNESLTIFYRIEKPSGVEITSYPSQYYILEPNTEIAGNFNISVDPYLETRSFTIKFWLDSFTEFANKTVQSNRVFINLTILSNSSIFTTTITAPAQTTIDNVPSVQTTTNEVPIEIEETTYPAEVPTINPPTMEEYGPLSYKEYLMITLVVVLFLLLPLIMLRKLSPKKKPSTSFQE